MKYLMRSFPSIKKRYAKFTALQPYRTQYYDRDHLFPKTVTKVFLPNPNKKKVKPIKTIPRTPTLESIISHRLNKLDIQMIPKSIHSKIFQGASPTEIDSLTLQQCKQELAKHSMITKMEDYVEDIDLKIPPLLGKDLEEHFHMIGEQQAKPYRDLVLDLLARALPPAPKKWLLQPGWTRYATGRKPERVDYPLERNFVFDVEVCMRAGKAPTLATAVSSDAWYGWVSDALISGTSKPVTNHQYSLESLIPIESTSSDDGLSLNEHLSKPKVVIGHNVSFDRARIKEQYWHVRTGTRFIDTMSLHISVSGLTSYQRAVLKSGDDSPEDETWKNISSLNSLVEVYKLYCGGTMSKETREIFMEGTLNEIREDFDSVMHYCSGDVLATFEVTKKLFPLFLERFPHPVTLAGMMELGTAYLPVNSNWNQYVNDSNQAYEDLNIEAKILLSRRADNACQLLYDDKFKEDIWMWDQDWEVKNIKMKEKVPKKKKPKESDDPPKVNVVPEYTKDEENEEEPDLLKEKFAYLWETKELLPKKETLLPGYPNWYRKLCTKPDSGPDWVPGPHSISTSKQVTPKLLSLTWEGYPLHYIREKGWGFLIPFTDRLDINRKIPLRQLLEKCPLLTNKPSNASGSAVMPTISSMVQDNLMRKEYYSRLKKDNTQGLYKGTGIWCQTEIDDCCWFFKLPHKDGTTYNVGNPLAKDFLNKFSENVLAGDTESAERVLSIARMLSYWKNNRDRILEQMIVWLPTANLPKNLKEDGYLYGAILPQVVVSGTLTRRAVEPTWMTASNAHKERVGSELRGMVQAPPGYRIVGADVDSQELWIASVIGDAYHAKMHGATPLGWMTLSGNKSNGTDMHSVTAKAVGISRDHAKVINYARIYGAGQNFAERLLKQFNPSMPESEARSKATKMFALTKGKRIYRLRKEYMTDLPDESYSKWQAFSIAKSFGKKVDEVFCEAKWVGGTESAIFNRLEEIANSCHPCTPFLDGRLSRALEPNSMTEDKYLPTRINWVVQSGAVDFLHLMLVCMKWIMGRHVRFCLSFHDEVRYLVPEELKYQTALAMHITNLLTRSFCAMRLGLNDLPRSVAFFSSVEIDTALRKESKHDCVTPSNPHGLERGYGIPNGESLDIKEAVEKARGHHPSWYNFDSKLANTNKCLFSDMSRATKRKHVMREIWQDDLAPPAAGQLIVKVLRSKGNNLHEVQTTEGDTYLVSMPNKFRRNIWIKRGQYVIVDPIEEGNKVRGEISRIVTDALVKQYHRDNIWPVAFEEATRNKNAYPVERPDRCRLPSDTGSGSDGELFRNSNIVTFDDSDDSGSESCETDSGSDSDTEENEVESAEESDTKVRNEGCTDSNVEQIKEDCSRLSVTISNNIQK